MLLSSPIEPFVAVFPLLLLLACDEASSFVASLPALTSAKEGPYSASNLANDAETKSDTLIFPPFGVELDFSSADVMLLLFDEDGGTTDTSSALEASETIMSRVRLPLGARSIKVMSSLVLDWELLCYWYAISGANIRLFVISISRR